MLVEFVVGVIMIMMVLLLCSTISIASPQTFDVSWQAQGSPGFITIDGKGAKASCQLDASGLGICEVPLADFKTGIDMRDKHMREKYLLTDKYPKAVLHIISATNHEWFGELTLKGKTKVVKGSYTLQKDGQLEAVFTITLDAYGIGVPSYLGVTVAKEVAIKVTGQVK